MIFISHKSKVKKKTFVHLLFAMRVPALFKAAKLIYFPRNIRFYVLRITLVITNRTRMYDDL